MTNKISYSANTNSVSTSYPYINRTEQNRTEQNRTEQNRTEQNRTEQNRTEQNRTEQNRTEQNRTEQNRTEQNRPDQTRTEQNRTEQNRTEQNRNRANLLRLLTLLFFSLSLFAGGCPSPTPTYTITFNSNGGSNVPNAVVTSGDKATKPTDPTRDLYTFAGWYKEPTFKTLFDFATEVVIKDDTLYALWLTKPTLIATVISTTQIDLSWNAVSGARKYNLFDKGNQIGGDITDTKYSHTGLAIGSTHSYTLIACNSGGCSEASTAVSTKTLSQITVTELAKGTGKRDRYGVFTISATTNVSKYRLAVKKASDPAPTATEMESGHHIKRDISTTPIHILIAHYLDAPILTWYNNGSVLPTGMTKTTPGSTANLPSVIKDYSAGGANKWIDRSVLATSTPHILYGMEENSSKVFALLTFTTDATTNDNSVTWDYVDPELGKTTITINSSDSYIFIPLQYRHNETANTAVIQRILFLDDTTGMIFSTATVDVIGTPGTVYENINFFFTGSAAPTSQLQGGILMETNQYLLIPTNKAQQSEIRTKRATKPRLVLIGASGIRSSTMLGWVSAIPSGIEAIPSGIKAIPSGIKAIPSGIKAIPSGTKAIPSGIKAIPSGTKAIPSGIKAIPSGIKAIPAGVASIPTDL
ncbi:hypothetical protein CHS0354_023977 [Potamilus streckersoni]|uniref:Uncharacterized protein n=1 Tax=Potamilus streckersoni TaxID=2493646 RepID=A0AAE0RZF2_9BIVA|nr:hypothetical protein CHS0354_023977 [Potamilus streckersoni]